MDNHFPDDMTYWSERPSLPIKYKPPKKKSKVFKKDVKYTISTSHRKLKKGEIENRIFRVTTYYVLGLPLYTKTTEV